MTKQEKIQEAWELLLKDVASLSCIEGNLSANGWISMNLISERIRIKLASKVDAFELKEDFVRPKSLSGIENNNGWVKVESEDDLPKEFGMYWTIDEGKNEVSANTFGTFGKHEFSFSHGKISHYQPIEKPQSPIY